MTNTDAMTWPEPAPSLARAVAGEFRIVREIGRGGMGVVYLARDTHLDRDVAIKTLLPHLAADGQVRERFVREARTAAAVSHPNIVPIHAAAERDGVVYFVMGFVNGRSVADLVAHSGPLDVPASMAIVRQVAMGLAVAHARGVVHRDIKAENVLVDASGHVSITDFGIARVAEVQPLTATGTVLGSVHYMSPEQVTGDALDGRSDVYSLGVLWYYMLSGRFPFERATSPAILVAHVNSEPTPLAERAPRVPARVASLLHTMLAKSPDARPASAHDLLEALRRITFDDAAEGVVPDAALPAVAAPAQVAPAQVAPAQVAPVVPHEPLSSTEAHAVWARAAQLQAFTGVQAPPPEVLLQTAPRREGPPTTAYGTDLIRAAAEEAGIDARYVDRALAERVTPMAPVAIVVQPGDKMRTRPNWFFGAHTKIDLHASIPEEIDVALFEEIADDVREELGELVSVNAVGRTLIVMTNVMRPGQPGVSRAAQVQVLVRNGRTTVRAFEDLSQTAGAFFGAIGGGAGGAFGAMVMGIVSKATHSVPLGLASWAATAGLAVLVARFFFGRHAKKKERELRAAVERVVARVLERTAGDGGSAGALPPGTNFQG